MREEDSKNVSAIVLTRNSARTLERCIVSLIREKSREIIAIDAQSLDDTVSILVRHGVRVISDSHKSLGFARQLGVDSAGGKYVIFVDSDVELGEGCIPLMLRQLRKYGWVGIHARILSAENASYWQRCTNQDLLDYYEFGPTTRIDTIAALFKRDALLGYRFDSQFSESAEDVDLCRRLIKAHYTLGVSTATAWHLHRREFFEFVKQRYTHGYGLARIAMKYRRRELIAPVARLPFLIIHEFVRGRINMIPYWVVHTLATFTGVLIGYSAAVHKTDSLR